MTILEVGFSLEIPRFEGFGNRKNVFQRIVCDCVGFNKIFCLVFRFSIIPDSEATVFTENSLIKYLLYLLGS